jgi:hypothetical protein
VVSRLDLLTKTKAHAVERDNGSSSLQRKVLQESSTECFPYKMNKAEMKWMVRELGTAQLMNW